MQAKIQRWSTIPIHQQNAPDLERQVKHLSSTLAESADEPIDKTMLQLLYGLEQLDDVMTLFMTVTETLLAQLESAIEHHDVAVLHRMAHEIKGSSYAVSAKEMADLCLKLEAAAESENWSEAERLYTTLGLAFARVREFLTQKQNKLKDTIRRAS